jgi:DNA polymerase III delta subunit
MAIPKENITKYTRLEDLRPCYLYMSRSISILEETVEIFKKFLRGKISFEVDLKIFYSGVYLDEYEFVNFVKTPSFFSEKRVAVVKNVEKASAEFIKMLAGICSTASPGDFSTVIICTYITGDKKAKNIKSLIEVVSEKGIVENLYLPTAEKLKKWLDEKSELDGIRFTQKAALRLIENVNFDMNLLQAEYEKLQTYIISEKDKTINEVAVDKLVPRVYDMKIFDVVDHIGNRDKTQALKALKPLMLEKQNMIGIITLLHRMFKAFLYIKNDSRKKQESYYSRGEFKTAGKHNANSFKVYIEKNIGHAKNKDRIAANYLRFSRKYNSLEIIRIFDILNKYDISLRATEIEEPVLVTRLIVEITDIKA